MLSSRKELEMDSELLVKGEETNEGTENEFRRFSSTGHTKKCSTDRFYLWRYWHEGGPSRFKGSECVRRV